MSRSLVHALLAWTFLVCGVACGRRSGVITPTQERVAAPVPAPRVEARAPADAAAEAEGGATRLVGRKPVPVMVGDRMASAAFARAAAPGPGHPKGTIAVLVGEIVPGRNARGEGAEDVTIVEEDLATASSIRTIPLARHVHYYDMQEGEHGPLVMLESEGDLTVVWLDEKLSVRAQHSWPKLAGGNAACCAFAAVRDRAVLADLPVEGNQTRVWVLDDEGRIVARQSCPGRNVLYGIEIAPWKDRAVITGLGNGEVWWPCALRVDGARGVVTRSYPFGASVFARDGALYVESDDHGPGSSGLYALGDDLRRTGKPVADPRPPEVIAAESLAGYASRLRARLIEGLVVLQAHHCCGEYGPSLYVFDPHADFE